LTLPGLTDLEMYYSIDFSVPFFMRSHPRSLRRFHVHQFAQHLTAGVPFMPALEEIQVDDIGNDQLAEIFALLGNRATLVLIPRLHSIRISVRYRNHMDGDSGMKVGYEGILDALCTMKECTQLRSFRMECLEESGRHGEQIRIRPRADVHYRLLDLRDDGLEVYLGSAQEAWI
jgi:hypothetical protein